MPELIRLLETVGPDIAVISRKMGVHEETVRYWYKEKLLKKGMTLRANPDNTRLGLGRIHVEIEFSPRYQSMASKILLEMGERSYMSYFQRELPAGSYFVQQRLPPESFDAYLKFLWTLKEKGVLRSVGEPYRFSWTWPQPMRAELYNFDSYKWEASLGEAPMDHANFRPIKMSKFDFLDLKILEQKQVDANKSLRTISQKLGLNYQRTIRHYDRLVEHGLISGYSLDWHRDSTPPGSEKPPAHEHTFLAVSFLVRGVSRRELRSLVEKFRKIPFVSCHYVGDDYFTQLFIPMEFVNEVFSFLASVLSPLRKRVRYVVGDQSAAAAFTLPADLYDQKTRRWVFDPKDAATNVERIIKEISQNLKPR